MTNKLAEIDRLLSEDTDCWCGLPHCRKCIIRTALTKLKETT